MTGAIGIDTHRDTLAACALDTLGRPVAERTFANDRAGASDSVKQDHPGAE